MARPMDRDPDDQSVPLWFSQGRRVAEITQNGSKTGDSADLVAERIRAATQLPVHRARDYERAYRFLVLQYPEAVAERKITANFVAVSQLSTLHRLDRVKADELAPMVLKGETKASAVREVIDELLANRRSGDIPRILEAKRRVASFDAEARKLLMAQPDLLGIGPVDEIREVRSNARFEPDLVVRQGELLIGVEIIGASSSMPPHYVGRYLARLAQIEQKYQRAMLVLPSDQEEIAMKLRRYLREWIGREPELVLLELREAQ